MQTFETSLRRHANRRGSTLAVVMVLTFALAVVMAGVLSTMVTDKRVNRGSAVLDQARNAAEGAVEVAAAEFDRRANSLSTLLDAPLTGFTLPDSMRTTLAGPYVDPDSIEFKAGNLSPQPDSASLIDETDPFNTSDDAKGKTMSIRHAFIYGKATAIDPLNNHSVTSYVSTLAQVRTDSWLNYAVFGNLDLEFHAGPVMEIFGPVHSNQRIYVLGGNELRFYAACTTTKEILRRFKDNGSTSSHGAAVKFAKTPGSSAGSLVSMGTSQDSRMGDEFRDFARSRWDGFVQDKHFDIRKFSPPGMLDYIEDDYTTTTVDETRNPAYALIEPQLADVTVDDEATATYAGSKDYESGGETVHIENLKLSAVSGLTIRVKRPPTGAAGVTFWENTRRDNDDPLFEPGYELVYFEAQDPLRPLNRDNMPVRASNGKPVEHIVPTDAAHMSPLLRNRLFSAIRLIQYRETGSAGNSELVPTTFAAEADDDIDPATASNRSWYGIHDRRQGYQYADGAGATNNLGYRGAHHLLQIDMGKLHGFLNPPDASEWQDRADTSRLVYNPATYYSGAIYVQFPLEPYTGDVYDRRNTDKVRPAVIATQTSIGFGLVLRNASVLPSLPAAPGLRDEGLTLGTNGPAYILGHYNADGNSSTGSSRNPDPAHAEVPALIAADSITLLSANYAGSSGEYFRYSYAPKRNAAFTEVSAALFAGTVPTRLTTAGTGTHGARMGGVHNFIRLLENWSGQSYRYRGSIGLLFENEVHLRPYYEDHHGYWYGAPTRDVGYHLFFANGRLTPAWPPFLRTTRRITVDDITAAQWEAGPPTPPKAN